MHGNSNLNCFSICSFKHLYFGNHSELYTCSYKHFSYHCRYYNLLKYWPFLLNHTLYYHNRQQFYKSSRILDKCSHKYYVPTEYRRSVHGNTIFWHILNILLTCRRYDMAQRPLTKISKVYTKIWLTFRSSSISCMYAHTACCHRI
jgi:hypothetical protein